MNKKELEAARALYTEMGWDDKRFAKEEQKRRKQQQVLVKGSKIAEQIAVLNMVKIIDPLMGSNNRIHRLWMNRIGAHGEEGGEWRTLGHRHTVEAVIYILQGHGHSIIDGKRYDWEAGDMLSVPVFSWHRHINDGDEDVIRYASTTGPLSKAIGQAIYEDERHPEFWVYAQEGEEAMSTLIPGGVGDVALGEGARTRVGKLYAEQLAFAAREEQLRRESKVLVKGSELEFEQSPMGLMAYMVDPRIGFHQKVLAVVMAEIPPHKRSGAHRHLYDEIDCVLAGRGKAIVDDKEYEIERGDVLSIPVFAWHQYFNTGDEPLRILVPNDRPGMENLVLVLTQQGELADH